MKRRTVCLLFITFYVLISIIYLKEPLAAPYYEGKILKIIVGAAPGGGYDRIARILQNHLHKYIPGNPTIIVENMQGGAGIVGANYLYNIAKPDGLTIGTFNRGLPFAQLVNIEGVKFDMTKFSWIGSVAVDTTVLIIRNNLPYKTFGDLQKAKKPVYLSTNGPAGVDYQFPFILQEFLGVNFKMVIYNATSDCLLAMERKEVDGKAGSYGPLKPFVERGLAHPVIRGRFSEPGLENLPVNEALTTDKKGETIMAMFSSSDLLGRFYVAPPGTPSETMNILRDAFTEVTKDPKVQVEGRNAQSAIKYVSAEEILNILNFVFNQPEEIVKAFSKYIKF